MGNSNHKVLPTPLRSKRARVGFGSARLRSSSLSVANTGEISNSLQVWKSIEYSGEPMGISGHGIVVVGSKAYVFGGCGGPAFEGMCLDNFFCFDFETFSWTPIKAEGQGPSPRASFAMCLGPDNGTIIVAGGTGDSELCSDIFEYNTFSRQWRMLDQGGDNRNYCKLYGQTVTLYNGHLYFFGGSTGKKYTNDLVKYDVTTMKWEKIKTTGQAPSPRYKHQAIVIGDELFIIGGGNYRPTCDRLDTFVLSMKSLVWRMVPTSSGSRPESRVAHTCQYEPRSNKIYMWGGFNRTLTRLNDFAAFDLESRTWSAIDISRAKDEVPSPRAFHASCIYGGGLYIFGGADGDTRHSDLWRYQVHINVPSLMVLSAKAILQRVPNFRSEYGDILSSEVLVGIEEVISGADRFGHQTKLPSPTAKSPALFS